MSILIKSFDTQTASKLWNNLTHWMKLEIFNEVQEELKIELEFEEGVIDLTKEQIHQILITLIENKIIIFGNTLYKIE